VSLARLWAFLAVALPVLAVLIVDLPSVDLTYHLRAGAQILDTGAIPTTDTWTFTAAGLPWVDQQWGSQVILATTFRTGGWTGLVLLKAFLVFAMFGCLFVIARRQGMPARLATLLVLAAFGVAAPTLSLRPQLIAMTLFALVLLLVADRRVHPGRVWLVPVVVLVWANIHGSFFLGPIVLGLAWIEDVHDRVKAPRRMLWMAIAAGLAACLTPTGPWVWSYAFGLSTNAQITNQVAEWRPTSLRDAPGLAFFISAFAVVAAMARRASAVPWPTLLWLLVFFVIGAYAERGLAWWPLAVVPVIAGGILPNGDGKPARRPLVETRAMRQVNIGIAAAIVAGGIILLPIWRPIDPGTNAPQGAVGFAPSGVTGALRDLGRPGDRVFHPQSWGSWFEFAEPDLQYVVDSRIELYPAAVWDAYGQVSVGIDGWQAQLDRWGVTVIVVRAPDEAFVERLTSAGWSTAYTDEDGSILLAPDRS
jgi:hypothetical protein